MRIDWTPDNHPITASRISSVTMQAIGALDRATSAGEVKRLFDDWMAFARSARVCRQICEHMVDKRRDLLARLEPPKTRPARDWKAEASGPDR